MSEPTTGTVLNNLPVQPTPFLGREKEVASVTALLHREDVRLVTLTGVGGTGKTRIGLQVAAELSAAFPDGVFFVNLAPINDPELVVPTIAQVLDVKETGGHSLLDLLKAFLREKLLLLLLDNFEQVVSAGEQVAELLAACPRLKILVTSRMVLRVRAEHEFSVPPLALPDLKHLPDPGALAQYEVVALFLQRAQAVRSDFQVTSDNAPAVAEICVRLDGLPLAIELAAARMKLLSPQALLARLGQRLHVLTGGARDAAQRQQTLRNTIEWSYQLLDSQEQRLFRRLSIFAGGCTLEAVEAIEAAPGEGAESTLDTVASLVDKSLLQRMEQEGQEEPRFVMLETIREYGLERLAASGEEEARKAHAEYFLALAEEASLQTERREQSAWLRRLDREHDNLHAAMSWSLEHTGREREMALRLGIALQPFWETHGYYSEGRDFLERALVGSEKGGEDTARAGILPTTQNGRMRWQGMMALGFLWTERDYAQAGAWFRRAGDLAEQLADPKLRARSLNRIGNWHLNLEQPHEALHYHQQALTIFRELRDTRGIAETLDLLGMTGILGGDIRRGTDYYQQAVTLFRELGDQEGLTSSLATVALRAPTFQSDMLASIASLAEALLDAEDALRIARATGHRSAEAYALFQLGLCLGSRGEYGRALEVARQSLRIAEEIEHRQWQTAAHTVLGGIYRGLLAYPQAHQHFQQALVLAREVGSLFWTRMATGYLASAATLMCDLDEAEKLLDMVLSPETAVETMAQRMTWCASVELALARGDAGRALEIIDRMNSAQGQSSLRLSKLRGEALVALQQAAEAEAAFEAALEIARTQGVRPMQWQITLALGNLYQEQKSDAEAEQAFASARALIEELAATIADESLGDHFLGQAVATVPHMSALSPLRLARQAFGGLTAREREVAILIAQGKSNQTIADELVVTKRTVETHIGNIMFKLGCTSRTQIAVWAMETGLVSQAE